MKSRTFSPFIPILLLTVLLAPFSASAADPSPQPVLARALAQFQDCSVEEARLAVQILASRPSDAGKAGIDLRTQLESIFRAASNLRSAQQAENATAQAGFMKGMLDRKLREADAFGLIALDESNRKTFAFVLNTLAQEAELSWRSAYPEDATKRQAFDSAKQAAFTASIMAAGQERARADSERRIRESTKSFRVLQVLGRNSVLATERTNGFDPTVVMVHGADFSELVDGANFSAPVVEDGRHQYTNAIGTLATVRKYKVLE